jgi:hypothetical protein
VLLLVAVAVGILLLDMGLALALKISLDAAIAAVARWVNPTSNSSRSSFSAASGAAAQTSLGAVLTSPLQQLGQQQEEFYVTRAPGVVTAGSSGCSVGLKAVTAAAAGVADAGCSQCYGLSFDWSHQQKGPLLVPDVHKSSSSIINNISSSSSSSSMVVAVAPGVGDGPGEVGMQGSRGFGRGGGGGGHIGVWIAVWFGVGLEPRQLMLGALRLLAAVAMCLLHPAVSMILIFFVCGTKEANKKHIALHFVKHAKESKYLCSKHHAGSKPHHAKQHIYRQKQKHWPCHHIAKAAPSGS